MGAPKGFRREVNMDTTREQLAALFMANGWQYANGGPVTPEQVGLFIDALVDNLGASSAIYMELGRFVVMRDSEFPSSFEIMLKVGHVSDWPINMDEPDPEVTL